MNILVCGSGPAAIQLAVFANSYFESASVHFLARDSDRNQTFCKKFQTGELSFSVRTSREDLKHYSGTVVPQSFVTSIDKLEGKFNLVILAQPTFEYIEVISAIAERDLLCSDSDVLTASSCLGVGAALQKTLSEYSRDIGLVLFSDYLAVSVRDPQDIQCVITSDEKKYLRSFIAHDVSSYVEKFVREFLTSFIEKLTFFDCLWEVEQGNTNLFHIPIIVNQQLVSWYFDPEEETRLFYGPYPWGAYSVEVINNIVQFEEELLFIYNLLGLPSINFFEFRMSRANLPGDLVSPDGIKNYTSMSREKRASLHTLFLWMTERKRIGIRLDGKVADVSSLPKFPRVKVNENKGVLPRIPLEDYVTLKALDIFSQTNQISNSLFSTLCSLFEESCRNEPERYGYKLDFDQQRYTVLAMDLAESFKDRQKMIIG